MNSKKLEEDNHENFKHVISKELAGTKTERNLKDAYCGESKARNNYTFFAKQAREDGYNNIARIFEETAANEMEHAKIWLKILSGGSLNKTMANLEEAAGTENYEWEDMYARFAQDARDEGFDKIAILFENIRKIEKMHMTRYKKLIDALKNDTLLKSDEVTVWECAKCGYTHEGQEPPGICPFCCHPKEYYFQKCFNY